MYDLASRSDHVVNGSLTRRYRDGDVIVRETPSRPNYWFGHGYESTHALTRESLAELAARGRAHFGAIAGTESFVIFDEYAEGARTRLPDDALPLGTAVQRDVVFVFPGMPRDETPEDPVVHAVTTDAEWARMADLYAASDEPDPDPKFEAFHRETVATWRADHRIGNVHVVGVTHEGVLVSFAGLYRDAEQKLARFITPVTDPAFRRQGMFAACLRALIRDARSREIATIVTCAAPGSEPDRVYRKLGFVSVAERDCYIVTARLSP